MLLKPPECATCPLYGDGQGFSRPDGAGVFQVAGQAVRVLLVGDSLGWREAQDGLPFRPDAPAGSVLERVISRAGFARGNFRLWNIVACQPPSGESIEGESWEQEAVDHCRVHFDRVVEGFKPQAILALGSIALKALTGMSGPDRHISDLRGYVLGSQYAPVIPTFHPSYLRRGSNKARDRETGAKTKGTTGPGMALLGVLIHDLQRAVAVASSAFTNYILHPEYDDYLAGYVERPTVEDARAFLREAEARPEALIAYDLEHPSAAEEPDEDRDDDGLNELLADSLEPAAEIPPGARVIYSIQFSLGRGTGTYFPWVGEFVEIARRILNLPNPKAGHYVRKNDNPRLATWGIQVREPVFDTWDSFHHLQPDIPAKLQFAASFSRFPFPWKHWRREAPERYGIADVDAIHYLLPWCREAIRARGLDYGYRQVRELGPVFDGLKRRGIPVNEDRRQDLKAEIDREIDTKLAEIQALVPDEARRVEKDGYERLPAHVRQKLLEDPRAARIEGPKGETYVLAERRALADPPTPLSGGPVGSLQAALAFAVGPRSAADTGLDRPGDWSKLGAFNPDSWQQVLAYVRAKGYEPPTNRQGSLTTEAIEMERLGRKTRDPFFRLILESRELTTLLGTFVLGWAPGRDGRVHPDWLSAPASGQHSSRNPNAQNFPKHTRLAKKARAMIEARPGCRLVSFDWKSFHVLTLGFEARDPDYIRIARIDMHSFLAAHLARLPERDRLWAMPDDELRDRLKWFRSCGGLAVNGQPCGHSHAEKRAGKCWSYLRNNQAKRTILGYGFGQTAKGLYDRYREVFPSIRAAQETIDLLDGLFPKPAVWRRQIREVAHRQGYLVSRYGFIRWFWDVLNRDPRTRQPRFGDDSEACVAFLPANDAFGLRNDVMIAAEERGWNETYGLIDEIHDDLCFECPDGLLDDLIPLLKPLMEAPSPVLVDPLVAPGGLWCAVGVQTGRSWADMEDLKV